MAHRSVAMQPVRAAHLRRGHGDRGRCHHRLQRSQRLRAIPPSPAMKVSRFRRHPFDGLAGCGPDGLFPQEIEKMRGDPRAGTSRRRFFDRGMPGGCRRAPESSRRRCAVIEVEVTSDDQINIPRVDVAIDCGAQVNSDRVRSQVEGSCVMGISLARSGEISFKDGRVQQTNFHEFQVACMQEAPREIRVHSILGAFDTPLGGVGEPAVPPIALALCNAIFAATGKRTGGCPSGSSWRLSARARRFPAPSGPRATLRPWTAAARASPGRKRRRFRSTAGSPPRRLPRATAAIRCTG